MLIVSVFLAFWKEALRQQSHALFSWEYVLLNSVGRDLSVNMCKSHMAGDVGFF